MKRGQAGDVDVCVGVGIGSWNDGDDGQGGAGVPARHGIDGSDNCKHDG